MATKTMMEMAEEARKHYKTTGEWGYSLTHERCEYLGGNDVRCVIGRWCKRDEETDAQLRQRPSMPVQDIVREEYLDPQYAGHPIEFYEVMQGYHDNCALALEENPDYFERVEAVYWEDLASFIEQLEAEHATRV